MVGGSSGGQLNAQNAKTPNVGFEILKDEDELIV